MARPSGPGDQGQAHAASTLAYDGGPKALLARKRAAQAAGGGHPRCESVSRSEVRLASTRGDSCRRAWTGGDSVTRGVSGGYGANSWFPNALQIPQAVG